jgi:hypothetical protein
VAFFVGGLVFVLGAAFALEDGAFFRADLADIGRFLVFLAFRATFRFVPPRARPDVFRGPFRRSVRRLVAIACSLSPVDLGSLNDG